MTILACDWYAILPTLLLQSILIQIDVLRVSASQCFNRIQVPENISYRTNRNAH